MIQFLFRSPSLLFGLLFAFSLSAAAGCDREKRPREAPKKVVQRLVAETPGLRATFYSDSNLDRPVLSRVDPTVDFNWGLASPAAGVAVDGFSARWQGHLQPRFTETYTFLTRADDGVRLWVNGQLLIDNWVGEGVTDRQGTIALVAGNRYDIRLEYFDSTGSALVQLSWQSAQQPREIIPQSQLSVGTEPAETAPSGPSGLNASYFQGTALAGQPLLTRVDPNLDFDWGSGAPGAGVPADNFSARWRGLVQARFSETYTFITRSAEGVRLSVNGQQLVNSWASQTTVIEREGTIALTAGVWYDIQLEYFEESGTASVQLSWRSASQPRQAIPSWRLSPGCNDGRLNTLVVNGGFECDIAGWAGGYWSTSGWATGATALARAAGAGGTQGALRVTLPDNYPTDATPSPPTTYYSGAQVALKQELPAGSWIRVAFDARRLSGSPHLAVERMFGGSANGGAVALSDDWRSYGMTIRLDHATTTLTFNLQQPGRRYVVAGGEFLLDNVSVTKVPRCTDVAAGDRDRELVCFPPQTGPEQTLRVSFSGFSISGPRTLRATGPHGSDIGDNSAVILGTTNSPHQITVRDQNANAPLSLRLVPQYYHFEPHGAPGVFNTSPLTFSVVAECNNNAGLDTTLSNGGFECDRSYWSPQYLDEATGTWRGDVISLDHVPGAGPSQGALRVTFPTTYPPGVAPSGHVHQSGAVAQFKQNVPEGFVTVSFDARRVSGSPHLILSRPSGGSSGINYTQLADEWRPYALTFRLGYPTNGLFFSLWNGSVRRVAPGAFDIDNVRITTAPTAPVIVTVTTASGAPVSGREVLAFRGSNSVDAKAITDAGGRARVMVPAGTYRFGTSDGAIYFYSDAADHCDVRMDGGCRTATIRFGGEVPNIAVTPETVSPGATVDVVWRAIASAAAGDHVGLYPVGAPGVSFIVRQPTGGSTSGNARLLVPPTTVIGNYEARLTGEGGVIRATSNVLRVVARTALPTLVGDVKLIRNPSFEQNLLAWDGQTATTEVRNGYTITAGLHGSRAVFRTVGRTTADHLLSHDDQLVFPAVADRVRRYYVSAKVKTVGAARAAIRLYGNGLNTPSPAVPGNTVGTRTGIIVEVPAGTTPRSHSLRLETYGDTVLQGETGSAYFDDVRITALDPTAPGDEIPLLDNPSFEQNLLLWDSQTAAVTTRGRFSIIDGGVHGSKSLRASFPRSDEHLLGTDDQLILATDPTEPLFYVVSASVRTTGNGRAAVRAYGNSAFNRPSPVHTGADWRRIGSTVTVPPGSFPREYNLRVEAYGDLVPEGQTATAEYDEVRVQRAAGVRVTVIAANGAAATDTSVKAIDSAGHPVDLPRSTDGAGVVTFGLLPGAHRFAALSAGTEVVSGVCDPGATPPCRDFTFRLSTSPSCAGQPNGTPCSDGNACTTSDTCQSGVCQSGPALSCDDGNSCTADSCDPAAGCVTTTATTEGVACNDGDMCSTNDVCRAGACEGTPGGGVSCGATPRVSCVIPAGDGSGRFSAVFGYTSTAAQNLAAPAGPENQLTPPSLNGVQPLWLEAGDHPAAFFVKSDSDVTWTLGSTSVTATSSSPQCQEATCADGPGVSIGGVCRTLTPDPGVALVNTVVPTGTDVGATGGSFSVGSDGSASYGVRFWVPAGRSGIQPSLGLNYSSGGDDGLVGVGWSLSGGMSQVHRCPRGTRSDPTTQGIEWSTNDALCLNGQRLVLVAGTHMVNGAEYRTEPDTFARVRITSVAGSEIETVEVRASDGRIHVYGGEGRIVLGIRETWDADPSTEESPVQQWDNSSPRVRYAWLLSSTADRFGNLMEYVYGGTGSTTEIVFPEPRLSSIRYTSGPGGLPARREVSFAYRLRDTGAQQSSYVAGLRFQSTLLLDLIEMKAPNPAAQQVVRSYKLEYLPSTATQRPLLTSVTECDAAASAPGRSCKRPTTFSYEPGSTGFLETVTALSDARRVGFDPYWAILPVDLDHDGRDDIVYRNGTRWTFRKSTVNATTGKHQFGDPQELSFAALLEGRPDDLVVTDLDRDGFPDVMVPNPNAPTQLLRFRGRGTSSFEPQEAVGQVGVANSAVVTFDPDGKGLPHVMQPLITGKWRAYGPGFDGTDDNIDLFSEPTGGGAIARWNTYAQDVDGDGTTELLSRTVLPGGTPSKRLFFIGRPASNPQPWEYQKTTLVAAHESRLVKYVFADLNGDGVQDAVRLAQGDSVPSVIRNTGASFGPVAAQAHLTPSALGGKLTVGGSWVNARDPGVRVMDFDGDGRLDLLLVDNGATRDAGDGPAATRTQLMVLLSRNGNADGTGQLVPLSLPIPIGAPANGPDAPPAPIFNYKLSQLLDINGDGLTDILQVSPTDGTIRVHVRQGNKSDLLIGIKDGMGKKIGVTYRPMSDRAVYTPGQGCNYPSTCAVKGSWVVREWRMDNGVGGGQSRRTHHYKDARTDLLGTGWLGFAETVVKDEQTGTEIIETSDLQRQEPTQTALVYVEAGLPKRRTTRTVLAATGRVRSSVVDFSYELVESNDRKSYYTRPTEMRFEDSEAPTGLLRSGRTAFTYTENDRNFGTVRAVTTTTNLPGGATQVDTVTYDYLDGGAQWLIGIPTRIDESSTTPNGNSTRRRDFVHYPDKGAVRFETLAPGVSNDEHLETEFVRDPAGQVVKVTARPFAGVAPAREATIRYDSEGMYPVSSRNAAGHETVSLFHPALGVVGTAIDANGARIVRQYDRFGRFRGESLSGGAGVAVSYVRGLEPGSTAADERFTLGISMTRNGGGQLDRVLNRVGQEIRRESRNFDGTMSYSSRTYDDAGRLASVTRPAVVGAGAGAKIDYAYDQLSRILSMKRPDEAAPAPGQRVEATGSYQDLVSTFIGETGQTNRTTQDAFGRPAQTEMLKDDGGWVSTEMQYGEFGLLRAVVRRSADNLAITTTTMDYDRRGRQVRLVDPDAGERIFHYNAFGDLRGEVDGEGSLTEYVPDAMGRVARRIDKDGTTTFTWDVSPKGIGRVAETVSPSGVRTRYFYDVFGRPSRELWTIENQLFQLDLSYDGDGRLATVAYPETPGAARLIARQGYDPNSGRLHQVSKEGSTKVYWELKDTSPEGLIEKEQFGNLVETNRTYTPLTSRLETLTAVREGVTLQSLGYAYWADGNLARRSDLVSGEHERFEYDKLDRVQRWLRADAAGNAAAGGWQVSYQYSDFGNLTDRNFIAGTGTGGTAQNLHFGYDRARNGGPHAVTVGPWGNYGYDLNGNQKERPGGQTVTYTAFDLPKQISSATQSVSFQYDALGVRAVKRRSPTEYTAYVGRLYEKRVTGASTADHVFFIPGPEGPAAQVTRPVVANIAGAERTLYLHADRLGSVRSVTDDDGAVVEETKFDPFGNRIANFNQPVLPDTPIGGTSQGVTRGFTGHEMDDEVGLVNMQGRIYDPRAARFLTPDPIVQAPFNSQSHNRYSYVFNNPLRFTDPTGFAGSGSGSGSGSGDIPDSVKECLARAAKDPSIICDTGDAGTIVVTETIPGARLAEECTRGTVFCPNGGREAPPPEREAPELPGAGPATSQHNPPASMDPNGQTNPPATTGPPKPAQSKNMCTVPTSCKPPPVRLVAGLEVAAVLQFMIGVQLKFAIKFDASGKAAFTITPGYRFGVGAGAAVGAGAVVEPFARGIDSIGGPEVGVVADLGFTSFGAETSLVGGQMSPEVSIEVPRLNVGNVAGFSTEWGYEFVIPMPDPDVGPLFGIP